MRKLLYILGIFSLLLVRVTPASAQALPTSQPSYLQITIEDVKVGHDDDHSKLEAGWPAAFEKAKSPYFGIGMVAMTGSPQAWFITPYESNKAIGESMKLNADDPVLAAELTRLAKADAAHITNLRQVYLAARKDLSYGAFPDVGKQRFFEVTIFRVRPGHEGQFAEAGKAYGAATRRARAERVLPRLRSRRRNDGTDLLRPQLRRIARRFRQIDERGRNDDERDDAGGAGDPAEVRD